MLKCSSLERLDNAVLAKREAERARRKAVANIVESTDSVIHEMQAYFATIDVKEKDALLALFIARELGCPNLRRVINEGMDAL